MSQHHCCESPDCTVAPFTRNHYFTGKLLVERDFTDEQRYYVDKLRLHHQQLHGRGVVCGLTVKAHDNQACRDRMLYLEPGTAIDCCGHDILVLERECFDFTALPSFKAKIKAGDTDPHVLQVCLHYHECPTEEIPVLFDECGCDDTQCAPNRILESYTIDVVVDPGPVAPSVRLPSLSWESTASPTRAWGVALHEPTRRLYAISANSRTVFQLDTDNLSIVGAHTLTARARVLAISRDGSRLYVVAEADSGNAADPRQLIVLNTANNISDPPISASTLTNSGNSDIYLAVTPTDQVVALVSQTGEALLWPAGLATDNPAPTPAVVSLGAGVQGLAISSSGALVYTVDPANKTLPVLDISAQPPVRGTNLTVLAAAAAPTDLALVASSGPDRLAVISLTGQELHLVGLNPPALLGSVRLAHGPFRLAVSPGGQWAYVLERDGAGRFFVQAVNLYRILRQLPPLLSSPFPVGRNSTQIVVSPTGRRLYLPFAGNLEREADGGIAILRLLEEACPEILWRNAEHCPSCTTGDCVVLATIENYRLGDRIEDETDPPANREADAAAHVARINNRAGRRLLPSVQSLAELVECLLDAGPGGPGPQGPPGPPGQPGQGIDDVDVTFLPCENGVPAQGTATLRPPDANGRRILALEIPQGCEGRPGRDGLGLNPNLPKILDIEWSHNSTVAPQDFYRRLQYDGNPDELISRWRQGGEAPFLTVYFNRRMTGTTRQTFRVSLEFPLMLNERVFSGIYNPMKIDLYGHVIGVENTNPARRTPHTNESYPWAVCFIPYIDFFRYMFLSLLQQMWDGNSAQRLDLPTIQILLKGDFIWAQPNPAAGFDENQILDADNLGGQVGINRVRGGSIAGGQNPSGDLVQGGNFESWFFLEKPPNLENPPSRAVAHNLMLRFVAGIPVPTDVNTAAEDELEAVRGIGPALRRRILAERQAGPFADLEDFRARLKLSGATWRSIRDQITAIAPEE